MSTAAARALAASVDAAMGGTTRRITVDSVTHASNHMQFESVDVVALSSTTTRRRVRIQYTDDGETDGWIIVIAATNSVERGERARIRRLGGIHRRRKAFAR